MATTPTPIELGKLNRLPDLNVINYTNLDFKSIKAGIVDFINKNYPDVQNDFYESGGAAMIIDILSYINDILAFRADFLSNEAYLPTASTEKSIYNLLSLINYVPAGAGTAAGNVSITLETADTNLTQPPSYNQLNQNLILSTANSPLLVSAADESGNALFYEIYPSTTNTIGLVSFKQNDPIGKVIYAGIIEGRTYAETKTVPIDVTSNYSFTLANPNLLTDTLMLSINGVPWTETKNFAFENGATQTYLIRYSKNSYYDIVFGDGIFGAIPPAGAVITLRYRVGGGPQGNLSSGAINQIVNLANGGFPFSIRVQNTTSLTGGQAPEDLNFSKFIAPKNFATQLRAVTGEDYTVWALAYKDGTNGAVTKAVTALRPYLTLYGRNNGPYNITDSNKTMTINYNGAQKTLTLPTGTNISNAQMKDLIQQQIDIVFQTGENKLLEAYLYPSFAYQLLGAGSNAGFDVDQTITLNATNNVFLVSYNGAEYTVTLPTSDMVIDDVINNFNNQVATGANTNLQLFRADKFFVNGKFYLDIHSTGYYEPTLYPDPAYRFILKTVANSAYGFFGFTVNTTLESVYYEVQKPAIGLNIHTPDSSLEAIGSTNTAFDVVGIPYSTGSNGLGRALPMAANYVDLYTLTRASNNIQVQPTSALKSALRNFLGRYKVLTDKVTVWGGLLKYISLNITITVSTNYVISEVGTQATALLADYMSGNYNDFGEAFYLSKIYELLENIDGVDHADINDIKVNGISQLTTGTKLLRNESTMFNEIYVRDQITLTTKYKGT